jgi:hypothetical protein
VRAVGERRARRIRREARVCAWRSGARTGVEPAGMGEDCRGQMSAMRGAPPHTACRQAEAAWPLQLFRLPLV